MKKVNICNGRIILEYDYTKEIITLFHKNDKGTLKQITDTVLLNAREGLSGNPWYLICISPLIHLDSMYTLTSNSILAYIKYVLNTYKDYNSEFNQENFEAIRQLILSYLDRKTDNYTIEKIKPIINYEYKRLVYEYKAILDML